MERNNSPSKAQGPATATIAQSQALVVGSIGAPEVTIPDLTPRLKAAADAVEQYKGYIGSIDCDEVQVFVNDALVNVKVQTKAIEKELTAIIDPLIESRRQALAAKNRIENLFAPILTHLKTAEKILKGELLRYDAVKEKRRLAEEAEARRRAEEERRRLEDIARREAEEAARKVVEEQERAAALERAGQEAEAARVRKEAEERFEQSAERVEEKMEEAAQTVADVFVPDDRLKLKGTSMPGQWVSDVVDVKQIFAGIADGSTPIEAARLRVDGRIVPIPVGAIPETVKVEGIEISMAFFNAKAREQGENFAYKGMKARYTRDVRVRT